QTRRQIPRRQCPGLRVQKCRYGSLRSPGGCVLIIQQHRGRTMGPHSHTTYLLVFRHARRQRQLTALRLAVDPARTAEPGIEMSALVTMVLHFAWYAGLVVVLRQLERRWPAGEQTTRQEQLYNFGLAVIAALTTTLLLDLGSVSGHLRRWIGIEAALVPGWTPRGWVEWILGSLLYLVIWDLLQYWYHRLQHVVPQLWP